MPTVTAFSCGIQDTHGQTITYIFGKALKEFRFKMNLNRTFIIIKE